MERQLHLLTDESTVARRWRIDAQTKALGRRGLAQARAALRAAQLAPSPTPSGLRHPSSSNVRRPAA